MEATATPSKDAATPSANARSLPADCRASCTAATSGRGTQEHQQPQAERAELEDGLHVVVVGLVGCPSRIEHRPRVGPRARAPSPRRLPVARARCRTEHRGSGRTPRASRWCAGRGCWRRRRREQDRGQDQDDAEGDGNEQVGEPAVAPGEQDEQAGGQPRGGPAHHGGRHAEHQDRRDHQEQRVAEAPRVGHGDRQADQQDHRQEQAEGEGLGEGREGAQEPAGEADGGVVVVAQALQPVGSGRLLGQPDDGSDGTRAHQDGHQRVPLAPVEGTPPQDPGDEDVEVADLESPRARSAADHQGGDRPEEHQQGAGRQDPPGQAAVVPGLGGVPRPGRGRSRRARRPAPVPPSTGPTTSPPGTSRSRPSKGSSAASSSRPR